MNPRKEGPVNSGRNDPDSRKAEAILHKLAGNARPNNAWEALMMGEEWDERTEGLLDLLDEVLTERELWVVNALVFEKRSLRSVQQELGLQSHVTVANIRDEAFKKLREALA